ncbi:PFL_4703 family integrating conjugative element protein [Vibrio crassostreae]|uniref:PFL_4703 family integrating conjugative element protein n=1 Tax=Vibrio crassostreae TaxID=246167 RepID=UPI001B305762|nr:TIGR03746 family integrating conjugative element protein [Vibrio crassostreae]
MDSTKETNSPVDENSSTTESTTKPQSRSFIRKVSSLPKRMINKSRDTESHIFTLRLISIGLGSALLLSIYSNSQAPKQLTIRIPPDLSNGAVLSPFDFPKPSILSDTSYLWNAINTWKESGEIDTEKNLFRWQHFMSPEFQQQLRDEYALRERKNRGSLNRTRRVWAVPRSLHDYEQRVIKTGPSTWTVYLDMEIEEMYLGQVVKDTVFRYPLLVERYEANIEMNPLAIRIVGYAEKPYRVEE